MLKSAADLISEAQKTIHCVDISTARTLYESAESPVIIDVREADAASKSKLTNSINISRGLLEMKIEKQCPNPDALILLHCGGGGRASLAAQTLQQMGYTNVHAITARFDDILSEFG